MEGFTLVFNLGTSLLTLGLVARVSIEQVFRTVTGGGGVFSGVGVFLCWILFNTD